MNTCEVPAPKDAGFYRAVALWATCLSPEQDGNRGIVVAVELCPAIWKGTGVPTLAQVFRDEPTTPAAQLTRVVGVDQHYAPTSPHSLIGAELLELTPASIQDRLIQASFCAGPIG